MYEYIYIVIRSRVLFHNGSLLHSQLSTKLLITVHNSSRILTRVLQILELQPVLLLSSRFSTGSLIQFLNYTPEVTAGKYTSYLFAFQHTTVPVNSKSLLYTPHGRNHSNVFRLVLRYYGNATHELLRNSTATLLWKRYGVHRPCYQGKSNMSHCPLLKALSVRWFVSDEVLHNA
jgi:hypothetical protein